jgi:hypothetical protein
MDSREAVDLFVRRNDGGEPLSNSDIAFSLITVYWDSFEADDDPKDEFESYTTKLEGDFGDFGFSFGKGFVLRTLLMLKDEPPSFRRENLDPDTIGPLEEVWGTDEYKKAVDRALRIVTEDLELSYGCITSKNSILPIIYYCYKRLIEGKSVSDPPLDAMEYWISVTVLNNLLTIGSETILRTVQDKVTSENFPVEDILSEFQGRGIELNIDEDRIKEVVNETDYNSGASKHLLLTKIYSDSRISGVHPVHSMEEASGVVGDEESSMEIDHVYPRDKLNPDDDEELEKRGLSGDENSHRLGNLQLLVDNQSKGNKDPDDWLNSIDENDDIDRSRGDLIEIHRLPDGMDEYSYSNFEEFCEGREKRMVEILKDRLPVGTYEGA